MQPPRSILYWKIAVELVGHTFHITVLMGISYRSQSASLWPKIYSFPLLPAFGVFLFVFLSPFLMLNSFWNFLLWVNVFLNIYRPVYSCFFQSPKTSHLFSKGPSFHISSIRSFFFFFGNKKLVYLVQTFAFCGWHCHSNILRKAPQTELCLFQFNRFLLFLEFLKMF